jgi:hypothetical protein
LASVIDLARLAGGSTERPKLSNFTILPKDGTKLVSTRHWINETVFGTTDNLPSVIYRLGVAASADCWRKRA